MGRLTERKGEYCFTACADIENKYRENCVIYNNCYERKIHDKLAHYEDLEEAGRLYVLACGIEKPLYALMPQLGWKDGHLKAKWRISTVVPRDVEECLLWEDDMKRGMAFLTKEEAEAKLKELEGGANCPE